MSTPDCKGLVTTVMSEEITMCELYNDEVQTSQLLSAASNKVAYTKSNVIFIATQSYMKLYAFVKIVETETI